MYIIFVKEVYSLEGFGLFVFLLYILYYLLNAFGKKLKVSSQIKKIAFNLFIA